MKAAWAPTSGQWLGQTSGKTLGTAQLGSRDIFGGSSQRVVGPTRNRNSRTSQHSTSLFPGASILEDRRLLRSEEHTSELQSRFDLVCRLLLEKKKKNK